MCVYRTCYLLQLEMCTVGEIVNIPLVISRASIARRNSPGITYYMTCANVSRPHAMKFEILSSVEVNATVGMIMSPLVGKDHDGSMLINPG